MTVIAALYVLGLVFHTWCAYLELRDCDRNGIPVSLFAHVRVLVMLAFWPFVPIQILFEAYQDRIRALL